MFIFSTEEITIAAMRRGRDGKPYFSLYVAFLNLFGPFRCHDVPQRCRRGDLFCILLDALCGRIQRMGEISNTSCRDV